MSDRGPKGDRGDQGERGQRGDSGEPTTGEALRTILGAVILICTAILAITAVANQRHFEDQSIAVDREAADQARQMRLATFVGCVENGNPFRAQVRDEFVQVKTRILRPVFTQIEATLPPTAESALILDDAVDLLDRRVATIENRIPNVDCLESYPELPGQDYPPDLIERAEREAKKS